MSDDSRNSLASEEEIVDLLLAEYSEEAAPKNQIEKEQIWSQIKEEIRPKTALQQEPVLRILFLAAIVMISLPFILVNRGQEQNIKGVSKASTLIETQLRVATIDGEGQMSPYKSGLGTLVFSVSLKESGYIALALAKASELPEIRFVSKQLILPGQDQLIENSGKTYGYQLQAADQLRFCVLGAASLNQLQDLAKNLNDIWKTLPNGSCFEVKAP